MEELIKLDADGKIVKRVQSIVSDRVGHCWAAKRLRPGDIVLVDKLSGDCFYDCYLIDHADYANREGVHMRVIPYKFGTYAFGGKKLDGFTERDYHLLMAGEKVEVMTTLE